MTNATKKAARSVGADERPASRDAQRSINFNTSITKEAQFGKKNISDMPDKLAAIDGETLMELRLPPTRFCVQTLLPQGLTVLSGSPKIGKSWLTLDLCVRVAKGEPLWSLPTTAGTTLYLCLEDTFRRIQDRLLCITDEVPANAFFAVAALTLADGLADQIRQFVTEHPDTVLIAVDTFRRLCFDNIDNHDNHDLSLTSAYLVARAAPVFTTFPSFTKAFRADMAGNWELPRNCSTSLRET